MPENFWLWIVIGGGGLFLAVVLWSAWLYDRACASYRRHLKVAEQQQERALALLTRQEQLLGRVEALVERLERKLPG